jgi:hypothetical protein
VFLLPWKPQIPIYRGFLTVHVSSKLMFDVLRYVMYRFTNSSSSRSRNSSFVGGGGSSSGGGGDRSSCSGKGSSSNNGSKLSSNWTCNTSSFCLFICTD